MIYIFIYLNKEIYL